VAANGKWGLYQHPAPAAGYQSSITFTKTHFPATMSSSDVKAKVHTPPSRDPITTPSVILYGSISPTTPWQDHLTASLSDLPITIINPICTAWDSTWVEDTSDPRFVAQVEWEMDHGRLADVVVIYLVPGTQAPISLLELGIHASLYGGEKVVVCCPEGFWKRGNVRIVCGRFGVKCVEHLEEVERVVREKLVVKLTA
jgi:hypothetical protein